MYRIRFHGRGGQGVKTASQALGTAFFLAGFEVQDAPRYGAERRGAPIFAYVCAARAPIRGLGLMRPRSRSPPARRRNGGTAATDRGVAMPLPTLAIECTQENRP